MKRMKWAAALVALAAGCAPAAAQVKIGVLADMNSLYADITGKGSVVAAEMAAEDFGPVLGKAVEVVSGDHQNKADVGSGIARRWYDEERVDMITDGGSSAVALAVEEVSRQKKGSFCSPARPVPTSQARIARPTPRTGPTTPGRSRTAPARLS